DHLSLLAAPATLDRVYDFSNEAFDPLCDSLRASVPCIMLDVPHQWTGWTKRTLVAADEILVVAEPDLANLRNTTNLHTHPKAPPRPPERGPPHRRPPILLPQRGGGAKPPRDQAGRFPKGGGGCPGRGDPVRAAAVRHRRQQRSDGRGAVVLAPDRRYV